MTVAFVREKVTDLVGWSTTSISTELTVSGEEDMLVGFVLDIQAAK
jgi:hypothetical protein